MIRKFIRFFKRCIRYVISDFPNFIQSKYILQQWHKDPSTIYFVCPYGIGDTLFIASLINAYKSYYSIEKVVLVVKKSQSDLPDFFRSVDGKIVSDSIVHTLTKYSKNRQRFLEDNYRYGHFILNHDWPEPGQLLGIGGLNLIDIYKRCVLKIPLDANMELLHTTVGTLKMKEYQKKYGSNEKVVLLMPYAITLTRLPIEFWEKIAYQLKQKSYMVYTNVKDTSELPIKGTKDICLSLKDLFIISRTFHWICIALRSGICDLLGYSDVPLITIHNDAETKKAWNMNGLRLPNKNMIDIFLEPEKNIDENIVNILAKVG